MNVVTQVAALVGAIAYLAAAPAEMFLVDRPAAQRVRHVARDDLEDALRRWRPRGGSVLGTVGPSTPPLVAIVAAAI